MTKEEIAQAAEIHANQWIDGRESYYGFIAGANWVLQSENERLKAERDNTPIFHTCPECTWACSCSDQPCSCCKSQPPKQ